MKGYKKGMRMRMLWTRAELVRVGMGVLAFGAYTSVSNCVGNIEITSHDYLTSLSRILQPGSFFLSFPFAIIHEHSCHRRR